MKLITHCSEICQFKLQTDRRTDASTVRAPSRSPYLDVLLQLGLVLAQQVLVLLVELGDEQLLLDVLLPLDEQQLPLQLLLPLLRLRVPLPAAHLRLLHAPVAAAAAAAGTAGAAVTAAAAGAACADGTHGSTAAAHRGSCG